MKPVQPETKTSLLLDRNYHPFAFCTARAAIRHLITGRVKGVDAEGNTYSWDGDVSWQNNNIVLFEDQPCLRSAHEKEWAIPTVLVCTHHFGFHRRRNSDAVSLKTLYSAYKGICQYCLQPIPFHLATKDHLFPKKHGGSNHDFNLVLACKKCNNEKDSIFPYFDVNGNEVKPKRINNLTTLIPSIDKVRTEWKPYLYLE